MAAVHPKPDELEQLRSAIEPQLSECSAATQKWCTSNTLKRYLVARGWNVAKACAMLRATLTWREQFQPENITWSEIEHNASTGRLELLDSTDSLGRSV